MWRKKKRYDLRYNPKKSRGGIWVTNKFGKIKAKKRHPPKPIVKKCLKCGAKVLYHHLFCERCWIENQNDRNEKIETEKKRLGNLESTYKEISGVSELQRSEPRCNELHFESIIKITVNG